MLHAVVPRRQEQLRGQHTSPMQADSFDERVVASDWPAIWSWPTEWSLISEERPRSPCKANVGSWNSISRTFLNFGQKRFEADVEADAFKTLHCPIGGTGFELSAQNRYSTRAQRRCQPVARKCRFIAFVPLLPWLESTGHVCVREVVTLI